MAACDSLYALSLITCTTIHNKGKSSTSRRPPRSPNHYATDHIFTPAPRRRAATGTRHHRHHRRPHRRVSRTHCRPVLHLPTNPQKHAHRRREERRRFHERLPVAPVTRSQPRLTSALNHCHIARYAKCLPTKQAASEFVLVVRAKHQPTLLVQ